MVPAKLTDRNRVVDILSTAFEDNKSVNYIIPQDKYRNRRIKGLMEYSFDVCHSFGMVYLSDDSHACALILQPDRKKTTIKSLQWDLKLMFNSIGIGNIKKAMVREVKIKNLHPKTPMNYLWFIGVHPAHQGKGTGSSMLHSIIEQSKSEGRDIYLETSTLENLPLYRKFGFEVYDELNFGYQLFLLKKEREEAKYSSTLS